MRKRILPQYFAETDLFVHSAADDFGFPAYLCRCTGDAELILAYRDDEGYWWKFLWGYDRLIDRSGRCVQFTKRQYP